MKPDYRRLLACTFLIVVAQVRSAEVEQPEPFNRNRFSLSFDAGFNVQAEFRNNAPDITAPPATGSGLTGDPVNRNYQDGYNRIDYFDNGGGLTWNWGYDDGSQYVDTDNDSMPDSIAMHAIAQSGQGTSTDVTDDPQLGFELRYGRVMGKLGENKPWGFEGAFGYMNLSIKDGGAMSVVQQVTDTYALNGVVPPLAPYAGTFNGPGPLIADLPTRSVETASMSGWNELSGSLFALRLGPFLEVPLSSKFTTQFGLGLSLIYAATDYSYSQTAAFSDGTRLIDSGDDSSGDALVGGYLQGQVAYLIDKNWSVIGGIRVETASGLTVSAGNREAKLDLGATFHAVLGVGYSF